MRIISPRLLGVLAGLLAGLLLVLAKWKVTLILLGFGVAGYLVGTYLESREDVHERVRELLGRLFRS
jgi:uncharacterized membrane protein